MRDAIQEAMEHARDHFDPQAIVEGRGPKNPYPWSSSAWAAWWIASLSMMSTGTPPKSIRPSRGHSYRVVYQDGSGGVVRVQDKADWPRKGRDGPHILEGTRQ